MDRNHLTTLRRISPALGALGATAVLAAGAHAATRPAHATTRPAHAAVAPCQPRPTTIHGHRALAFCGPATASLSISGHTYDFHGGQCIRVGDQLVVSLGFVVKSDLRHNAGAPNFVLTLSGHTTGSLVAEHGGSSVVDHLAGVHKSSGPVGHGTYSGTTVLQQTPFHGSWNCHGQIATG
jgi:hypothetical protein